MAYGTEGWDRITKRSFGYYSGAASLIGTVITGVTLKDGDDEGTFDTPVGPIPFRTEGDCCSRSWVEHVTVPDLGDGALVREVREAPTQEINHPDHECLRVYYTSLVTDKGEIILEYRNSSNGYYGGSLIVG